MGEGILDKFYLDETKEGRPASRQVVLVPGEHNLKATLWFAGIGAEANGSCMNLLHLLVATEAPAIHMLQVCLYCFTTTYAGSELPGV